MSDDGAGIADPAVLLSFGENAWDDALVRREDAAGFGFASLARRNCAVSSRPRSPGREPAAGWRVGLAPEHFLGEADAEVQADEQAPYPHGTAISFRATEHAAAIRNAAEIAARHYPLPVIFEDRTEDKAAGPEELLRRAFLDGAVHAERWRGLVLGVFKNRHAGYNDPDLSFHVRTADSLADALSLPADVAFAGEAWSHVDDALPLVTADSALQPHELAVLLRAAFFSPSDDVEADSWETQSDRFDEEALHFATRLLLSHDEACRQSIAEAVRHELMWFVPDGRAVDIRIHRPDVTVTLAGIETAAGGA